ncbi:ABC transporter substrate-binding protein [Arcanobacterium hippocoleae]
MKGVRKEMITRRIRAAIVVSAILLGTLCACSTAQDPRLKQDGAAAGETSADAITLYVGRNIFEGSLDPIKGAMSYGYPFINNALLKAAPKGGYVGDLAESWKISEDALKYTFTLAPDLKFSDGSQLTAEDVVFTFQEVEKHQENNPDVDLTVLESAKALDAQTVEFTLNQPFSPFFDICAMLQIVPADAYDSAKFDTAPIGSGAYQILEYQPNQKIVLARNENYNGKLPEIERVTLVNLSQEAAFGAAQSGQLDAVMVPAAYTTEKIDGMQVQKLQTMDVRQLNLPVEKAHQITNNAGKPFTIGNDVTSDPAIRQALAIGIDRTQIIKNAFNGVGKPAAGFVGNLEWVAGRADAEKADSAGAVKLLENAGWKDTDGDGIREKDGLRAAVDIYAPGGDEDRYNLAVALSENAKQLGIELQVKTASWDEIAAFAYANPVVWGWGQYSPTVLPNLLHSVAPDTAGESYVNTAQYQNKRVDELISGALAANNQDDANKLWQEAQQVAAVDNPYLYIANIEHTYFVSDRLDLSLPTQIDHPHGHGSPILCNLADWKLRK